MSLIGQVDCLYVLHVPHTCASYMRFKKLLHVLYMPMDASLVCWALFKLKYRGSNKNLVSSYTCKKKTTIFGIAAQL